MKRSAQPVLISILFIVSGALGLIYQIVWFKYLSLFLGNTTYAQTIVLATFMGGLAVGAAFWGRQADRAKNAFRLYGILELLIGVYCLLYPYLIEWQESILVDIVRGAGLPSGGTRVLMLKFMTSAVSLLPPTILMGGTLPLLVRFLARRMEQAGKIVTTLYFLNSFGAVVGSLLGGFFLIRLIGLSATIVSAAVVNILVGVLAIRFGTSKPEADSEAATIEVSLPSVYSGPQVMVALSVAGLSGFAAMIYEVAWVRLLLPILGSSTYSFSIMLVAFIGGITAGSLVAARQISRSANLVALLLRCQVGVVVSMIIMFPMYGRLPYLFWNMAALLARNEQTYAIYLTLQLFLSLALMVVPTFFFGMSLPIATRIAARGTERLGRSVGNSFSFNTLGTVAGALAAGLLFIPAVGVFGTLKVGVAVNTLAALALLAGNQSASVRKNLIVALGLVFVVTAANVYTPDIEHNVMLSGIFRQVNRSNPPPATYTEFVQQAKEVSVLYYKEGVTATVAVIQSDSADGKRQNVLLINGKADASSRADLPTQVLLGQLPTLLHPNAKRALVIGYGSGVTAGSALTHPLERLDCVEISPEVIAASRWFADVNRLPLNDPRTHLHIEDALAFLKFASERYDIIVSEPSNPWIAGIGNLYSQEFFELCKQRMSPNGLMLQWFHLYEMDDEIFRLVLRTFAYSFRSVTIWQTLATDVILVGSQEEVLLSDSLLARQFKTPSIAADLERISIPDAATFLSLQMVGSNSVRQYLDEGFLNTQNHPRLEYSAPRAFFINRGVTELRNFDDRTKLRQTDHPLSVRVAVRPLDAAELRNIGSYHSVANRGNLALGYTMLTAYTRQQPNDVRALELLADLCDRLDRAEEAMQLRKRLIDLEPLNVNNLERYAWARFSHDRATTSGFLPASFGESERLMLACVKQTKDTVDRFRARMGDMYFGSQQYRKAADQYARALQIREAHESTPQLFQDALLLQLARSLKHVGKRDLAAGFALQATRFNPRNEGARDLLYDLVTGAK